MRNFHKHPIGARFVKKQPDNQWAVKLAKDMAADFACRGNGWHSWWDGNISSADFGLWVLYNVATGDTYVQKIFNPYNLPTHLSLAAPQNRTPTFLSLAQQLAAPPERR